MKENQNISLTTIVAGCRKQDSTAQRQLYDMFVLRLYNTSYRIVRSREDAEDAVHQAFRKAFNKIHTFQNERGQIYSWLSKICVNESIGIIKKRKVRFYEIEDKLTIASSAPTKLDHLEAEYIYKAINMLSEQQRIIFNLFEIEGYSHREISDLLNMNESTCRAYLTRAKSKLRKILSDQFPDQIKIN